MSRCTYTDEKQFALFKNHKEHKGHEGLADDALDAVLEDQHLVRRAVGAVARGGHGGGRRGATECSECAFGARPRDLESVKSHSIGESQDVLAQRLMVTKVTLQTTFQLESRGRGPCVSKRQMRKIEHHAGVLAGPNRGIACLAPS